MGGKGYLDLYEQCAARQARAYAAPLDELRARGRALPGAAEALRAWVTGRVQEWPGAHAETALGSQLALRRVSLWMSFVIR